MRYVVRLPLPPGLLTESLRLMIDRAVDMLEHIDTYKEDPDPIARVTMEIKPEPLGLPEIGNTIMMLTLEVNRDARPK